MKNAGIEEEMSLAFLLWKQVNTNKALKFEVSFITGFGMQGNLDIVKANFDITAIWSWNARLMNMVNTCLSCK